MPGLVPFFALVPLWALDEEVEPDEPPDAFEDGGLGDERGGLADAGGTLADERVDLADGSGRESLGAAERRDFWVGSGVAVGWGWGVDGAFVRRALGGGVGDEVAVCEVGLT